MYFDGRCPDYSFVISSTPPRLQELVNFLDSLEDFTAPDWFGDTPLSPIEFGLLLTPFWSRGYLPDPIQDISESRRIEIDASHDQLNDIIVDVKSKVASVDFDLFEDGDKIALTHGQRLTFTCDNAGTLTQDVMFASPINGLPNLSSTTIHRVFGADVVHHRLWPSL